MWGKIQLQSEQSLTWTWLLVWSLWRKKGLRKKLIFHVSSDGLHMYLRLWTAKVRILTWYQMSARFSQDPGVIQINWMTDGKRYGIFTVVQYFQLQWKQCKQYLPTMRSRELYAINSDQCWFYNVAVFCSCNGLKDIINFLKEYWALRWGIMMPIS